MASFRTCVLLLGLLLNACAAPPPPPEATDASCCAAPEPGTIKAHLDGEIAGGISRSWH